MHPVVKATGDAVRGAASVATRGASRSVASTTGISQDNIIFAMLILAFVIYITVKDELPTYLAFFKPTDHLRPAVDTVSVGSDSNPVSSAASGTLASGVGQAGSIISGATTGGITGAAKAVGGAIYNGIVTQPLSMIKGIGKSIGIPGF